MGARELQASHSVAPPRELQAPHCVPRDLQASHSVAPPGELQAPHCVAPPMASSSSLAHLVARSVSPTRPSPPVSSVELPVPAVLRNSGSAPSLPPLPPLLAPSRGAGPVRSRSVVAIHDSKAHAEAFQPLQRGTPHMFRTAPLPISPEGVGVASQSPLPPSLVHPPQQPPQPPTQRPGPRDDSCVVRLAQKLLPAAVAGQADNRHWRD